MRQLLFLPHLSRAAVACAALLTAFIAACHDDPTRPVARPRTTSYLASAVHCNATVAPASTTCESLGSVRARTRTGAADSVRKLVAAAAVRSARRTLNATQRMRAGRRSLSAEQRVSAGRRSLDAARSARSGRGPRDIIIGGQERFVRLNFYAPTFDALTREYTVVGDVWNLLQQTIGVLNFEGTEVVDTAGVKVFLVSGPSPSPAGPGTVTITNADGVATFIESSAPYFKMWGDALAANQYTGGTLWRMNVDPGVTAFEFTVFVAASVVDESDQGMFVGPAGFYASGATGSGGACVVRPPNAAYCWGDASSGALADGFDTRLLTPTSSPISGTLTQVVMGAAHGCGLRSDGVAVCWGYGAFGQLGTGAFYSTPAPAPVLTALRFDRLAAGGQSTCGIVAGGDQVFCWGRNDVGQLGDGTTTTRPLPVLVNLPPGEGAYTWNSITVGDHHACATNTAAEAYCWGGGESGQLGRGRAAVDNNAHAPDRVFFTGWRQVAAGLAHTCGINDASETRRVYCWGRTMNGETGTGFTGGVLDDPSLVALGATGFIAAGGHSTCALPVGGGELRCWGANDKGQLGDGTTTDRSTPVFGSSGNSYQDVTVGDAFACARRGTTVDCWGSNENSELGVNSAEPYMTSSNTVAGAVNAVSIAAGRGTACIANGTPDVLLCWGSTAEGAAGVLQGARSQPLGIRGLGHLSQVSVGANHACGIDPAGRLFCWGSNRSGQLAVGAFVEFAAIPVEIPFPAGVSGWASVSAGRAHTCAIDTFDDLYCWGANEEGQVGAGALSPRVDTPNLVLSSFNVLSVSAGGNHTCAVVSGEGIELQCWGSNRYGQVGTGSAIENYPSPQYISGSITSGRAGTLAAGDRHTCMIASIYIPEFESYDDRLECWGANDEGQVRGSGGVYRVRTPEQLPITNSPDQVVSGRTHSCARFGASVRCWGGNNYGQIVGIVPRQSGIAGPLPLEPAVTMFSGSSSDQTCLLDEFQHGLWCWGTLNSRLEFGTGGTWLPYAYTPAVP